ncbi:hypothetical protein Psta_1829 [Pirellula staleyi DSM 6068]|uniref:Uncharacterized protein n=1 Tax=Pirellula staleyi (strain ATCC 27377 / DSM 6068 / ICPB 4128) TaxID=530564 RepID=D2QZM0_PIRSD|nr:hypothetical protein Psta_1829 [Pirellula staleyi DSM 6068]
MVFFEVQKLFTQGSSSTAFYWESCTKFLEKIETESLARCLCRGNLASLVVAALTAQKTL